MIIASTNFFSYSKVDLKTFQYIHLIVFALILYATFFRRINDKAKYGYHYKSIIVLTLLPLLSLYSCYVINGQSYAQSLIIYRMHLGWLIYFYLWNHKIPYDQILKTIFIVGSLYMIITLIQQITYPNAPFGERTIGTDYSENWSGGVERRMGFYRFAVDGAYYGVLTFFFIINNKVKHKKILFVLLALSIVATGNRQTFFSVFVAMCFYYLFTNNIKYKSFIIILIGLFSLFIYMFADQIFGNLLHIQNDFDESRMPSYIFYWNEICKSPLTLLFGNGLPNSGSLYGQRIDMYGNFHVTPSDIGLVGTMYYWGVLYVLFYLVFAIRWLFNKDLSVVYKAIILSFLISSPIGSFLWEISGFLLQGILFYLCDVNARDNKLKKVEFEKEEQYATVIKRQ